MPRWRDVKKGQVDHNTESPEPFEYDSVSYWKRLKATVIDMFLIYTPTLYIITYFILDGKNDFQSNTIAQFVAVAVYALVAATFISAKGQTPGKRAYEIKVVDCQSGKNVSWFRALIRFVLFLFSCTILIGVLMPFWRADKKALHDLLSLTCVIHSPNEIKNAETTDKES